MQWSKLKSRVKDLICEELADRIDFHLTSYRKSHDGVDKVWILIDKKKVFAIKHYDFIFAERWLHWNSKMSYKDVEKFLQNEEIYNPQKFGIAMTEYLKLPISEAIKSSNPIIKALAMIDKRSGKRTLNKLEISDSDPELVKIFYNLRINQ